MRGSGGILISAHPEAASFGPGPRFSLFCEPQRTNVRLGSQKRYSLALNQKLPLLDKHGFDLKAASFWMEVLGVSH